MRPIPAPFQIDLEISVVSRPQPTPVLDMPGWEVPEGLSNFRSRCKVDVASYQFLIICSSSHQDSAFRWQPSSMQQAPALESRYHASSRHDRQESARPWDLFCNGFLVVSAKSQEPPTSEQADRV